jgi:hypothetical protein
MRAARRFVVSVIVSTSWFHVCGMASDLPKAKVTIIVKDQDQSPVDKARVGVGGTMAAKPDEAVKGETSSDGIFPAEVRSNGEVGVTARKDGYYDTFGPGYNFRNLKGAMERAFATDRWEPWNPSIQLTLKKIVSPVPMYARRVEVKFPVEATDIGFDLELSDWVAPYGTGMIADVIFRVDRIINSERDYSSTLQLSFSNKNDGIAAFQVPPHTGSLLRSQHAAPEQGYESGKVWRQGRSPTNGGPTDTFVEDERKDQNYFFRVRTVSDGVGRIKSALYGKIYGDIRLYVGTRAPKPGIGFTYYLNPTPNDRNLEFDPKRNLFTNLKTEERVTAP